MSEVDALGRARRLPVDARDARSAARFLIVGAVTAALYFGILAALVEGLALDYRVAVSIGYAIAVCFHFLANRRFTFRAHGSGVGPQLIRYAILLVVNYLLTLGVITCAVELLGWSPFLGALLGLVATTLIGFLLAHRWVFRDAGPA
jgi:putative flippase GtrA